MQQLDFIKYGRTVFNDLSKRHKSIVKDVEIDKCSCEIFRFDYEMFKY